MAGGSSSGMAGSIVWRQPALSQTSLGFIDSSGTNQEPRRRQHQCIGDGSSIIMIGRRITTVVGTDARMAPLLMSLHMLRE